MFARPVPGVPHRLCDPVDRFGHALRQFVTSQFPSLFRPLINKINISGTSYPIAEKRGSNNHRASRRESDTSSQQRRIARFSDANP
jgi:hypothetical protein